MRHPVNNRNCWLDLDYPVESFSSMLLGHPQICHHENLSLLYSWILGADLEDLASSRWKRGLQCAERTFQKSVKDKLKLAALAMLAIKTIKDKPKQKQSNTRQIKTDRAVFATSSFQSLFLKSLLWILH